MRDDYCILNDDKTTQVFFNEDPFFYHVVGKPIQCYDRDNNIIKAAKVYSIKQSDNKIKKFLEQLIEDDIKLLTDVKNKFH